AARPTPVTTIESIQWSCFPVVARIWESCFVMSSLPRQLWVNEPMASAADKKVDHCERSTKSIAQHKATEGIT
ncbi:MAG: hypothetical protein ABF303_17375, partial [Desulfobacterales bacterium]